MQKKKIIPVVIIVIAIAAAAYWYLNRPAKNGSEIILYGNVDIRQVSLAFSESERIKDMLVQEGDAVTKGQIVARLDTDILQLQMEQTQAQIMAQEQVVLKLENGTRPQEIDQYKAKVQSAQADVNLANQDYKRLSEASKASGGQAVSAQNLDQARAKLQATQAELAEAQKALDLAEIGPRAEDIAQAKAELKALKAQLALQQHRLTLAELKAPTNAVVRSRLLEPGDMAGPQQPVYMLALTSPKWVRAYAKETDLAHIKPGQTAYVYIDSFPDKAIEGQIGYIADMAEFTPKTVQTTELRTSLLYEIRVYVTDSDNYLRMGMPATVKIGLKANGK